MSFLRGIIENRILVSAVLAWLSAQILKTIIYFIVNKDFNAERLLGDGGMPSSHSATVCALATSTAFGYGSASFEFAVTAILAIIVMHDAMGVRRETGKQAKVINNMMEWFNQMQRDITPEERLKEFVGHSPMQVFFGALLGILVAVIICNVM